MISQNSQNKEYDFIVVQNKESILKPYVSAFNLQYNNMQISNKNRKYSPRNILTAPPILQYRKEKTCLFS